MSSGVLQAVALGRRIFFEGGLSYTFSGPAPEVGCWVAVPLKKETVPAVVWSVDPAPAETPATPLKAILGPIEGAAPLTHAEVALAKYLSHKYFTPLGVVLKNMTTFMDLRLVHVAMPGPDVAAHKGLHKLFTKNNWTQRRVNNLIEKEHLPLEKLCESGVLVAAWAFAGEDDVAPDQDAPLTRGKNPPLNREQAAAYEAISQTMHTGEHAVFLLEGVTGSGKTEVYLKLAEQALKQGRGALLLFPEIALTTQMIGRLSARFGERLVAFHSQQTPRQRARSQAQVAARPQSVVIGPRSALFVRPFSPAVVVVDEEHDGSYKQDQDPRYLATDVATFLCRHAGIPLVLGSATPRIESRWMAEKGMIRHLRLHVRHGGAKLPKIRLINMRDAHQRGQRGSITPELKEEIQNTLHLKKQTLIFLNRRGYHTVVLCKNCNTLFTCPHCSVALTVHQPKDQPPRLKCHYCGQDEPMPQHCHACFSPNLSRTGVGTQRAEEEVEAMFYTATVARVDRDAVTPTALEHLFARVHAGEVDILVGTQMLAKGLDFEHLHLVGVLDADRSMHLPDFRATERTFQHLVQVSGRSGRRQDRGLVLIQTLVPEHPLFKAAQTHDYDGFYRYEIQQREKHHYPPFSHLIKIMIIHSQQIRVVQLSLGLKTQLEKLQEKFKQKGHAFWVQGPTAAPLSKLKDDYRWQLSIRARDFGVCHRAVALALKTVPDKQRPLIRVDVEPQDWL